MSEQSTSGTERTTYIDEDGLRIPPEVREFDQQLVIRTPRSTIQHFGSGSVGPFYPMVRADDFGPVDEFRDPKNPDLAPDRVSIKPQGKEPIIYAVHTGGESA
ncbi:hypothetical protein IL252_13735 [Halomicrobium sp. IBSBa]|uniref:hypothetical protein n=1 Tax=Halomicrobium sp. IBSBa TaxID=2778916 RepID=UPI001ABFA26D|nr:hypothetical protein [Halomicrobium sp. IBSBa]MBO4248880.1 hypothetical protein [Halomicrobium sp. IBSBa]